MNKNEANCIQSDTKNRCVTLEKSFNFSKLVERLRKMRVIVNAYCMEYKPTNTMTLSLT